METWKSEVQFIHGKSKHQHAVKILNECVEIFKGLHGELETKMYLETNIYDQGSLTTIMVKSEKEKHCEQFTKILMAVGKSRYGLKNIFLTLQHNKDDTMQ